MGFILVLVILSLAIFVCISDTVFNMAASLRTNSRASRVQKEGDDNGPSSAGVRTS